MIKSRKELEKLAIPKFILEDEPACSQTDPELFFPVETELGFGGIMAKYISIESAKKICDSCPLKVQCLEYALLNNEIGIWGGTTERQREEIKRRAGRKGIRKSRAPLVW